MVEGLTVDRKKLYEQVAAHLERQILEGKLRPGEQLPPERDLQVRFGVGRPAIREALITLHRSGLIEIANGARARVAVPTASDVVSGMAAPVRQMLSTDEGQHQFQGVRLFFETGLARQAAKTATPAQVETLRAALEANRAALGNRPSFIETDVAFHLAIAEPCPRRAAQGDGRLAQGAARRDAAIGGTGSDRL
jgi:DNA-binding FadR family transcriptional regulator